MSFSVNTLNEVSVRSPRPKTNATALILWIDLCLFYVVAAMIEYAALLAATNIQNMDIEKRNCNIALTYFTLHMDRVMLILFPAIFLIHSAMFWSSITGYYYAWKYINKHKFRGVNHTILFTCRFQYTAC